MLGLKQRLMAADAAAGDAAAAADAALRERARAPLPDRAADALFAATCALPGVAALALAVGPRYYTAVGAG